MKLKYPALLNNHCLPVGMSKTSNRLLQLVAKGTLYEKCEELLQHQTGSNTKEYNCEHGEILDLHSWLAQLPDKVFRIPMHKLFLCISPVQQFVPSNGRSHVTATPSALSLPEVIENERTMIKMKMELLQ